MRVVAVVGLGYVGLPLAIEFGKKFRTIGFDLSVAKIDKYRQSIDPSGEVSREEFEAADNLSVTNDPSALREADYIMMVGYHPQVILAGRRINDGMGKHVAEQTLKLMIQNGGRVKNGVVNVLGLTFKENCADLRNSRVIDVINELQSYGAKVFVHDPVADPDEAKREYGIDLLSWEKLPVADALIYAVPHKKLAATSVAELATKVAPHGCVVDVKSKLDREAIRSAGLSFWRL